MVTFTKSLVIAKKALTVTFAALLVMSALAGTATAGSSSSGGYSGSSSGGGGKGGVPELDPGSMAGALTLLSGGVLMLTDKIRRRK